ncbi:uncharacterized protein LOC131168188 [Malania oleifera]|uniref:uncharacterized protein LOC131168188 n=1 Tax=Malania oleifera TaxID=397392 RepID=UPI0025ADC05D|nr:uncharacterized protein LOC131168188 [Malania oleifera]
MESSRPRSFFQDINSRELNGFRVRKRPYFDNDSSRFCQIGAVAVEHNRVDPNAPPGPPLAISFCKSSRNSHILSVSDEDGYVSIFDSRRKFPSFASYQENAEKARLCEWVAHRNAVFDVSWIKEDAQILTASGDQTIKVWDSQEQKCIGVLIGHTGSVKSLCSHSTNPDVLVSGSRDGSFALWDLRCKSSSRRHGELRITSTAAVKWAHISPLGKRVRRSKAASMSITSVLFLKDEVSIATAGAVDSTVKFWDTRHLKSVLTQTCPHYESSNEKDRRVHGISSLSQDSNGVFLSASCMDNRIYLYNVLQLEKGPIRSFSGCRIESFFVKSTISPDAAHILGGSSDGNAYIWQVDKPKADPVVLEGHGEEVTTVDWCPSEVDKIATSSDDFTVRFWKIQGSCSNKRSPSAIRRRVMATPGMECRQFFNEGQIELRKSPERLCQSDKLLNQFGLPNPTTMPKITTPKSQKTNFSSGLNLEEMFEKTPEAAARSPSSVFSPPSSLKKKTIRDYFLST